MTDWPMCRTCKEPFDLTCQDHRDDCDPEMEEPDMSHIHALLDEAAKHVPLGSRRLGKTCPACGEPWPCLVAKLAAELHHLRKHPPQTDD